MERLGLSLLHIHLKKKWWSALQRHNLFQWLWRRCQWHHLGEEEHPLVCRGLDCSCMPWVKGILVTMDFYVKIKWWFEGLYNQMYLDSKRAVTGHLPQNFVTKY